MFYSELGINAFFARCVSLAISSPEPTHYQNRTKENTSVRQSHIFKQSHIIKASKGNGLVVEEMIAQIKIRQLECSVEVTSDSASISKFFGTFFLFLQTRPPGVPCSPVTCHTELYWLCAMSKRCDALVTPCRRAISSEKRLPQVMSSVVVKKTLSLQFCLYLPLQ